MIRRLDWTFQWGAVYPQGRRFGRCLYARGGSFLSTLDDGVSHNLLPPILPTILWLYSWYLSQFVHQLTIYIYHPSKQASYTRTATHTTSETRSRTRLNHHFPTLQESVSRLHSRTSTSSYPPYVTILHHPFLNTSIKWAIPLDLP